MEDQPKKYYRQTYTVVVLTESPESDVLDNLAYNVNEGPDCLHTFALTKTDELTPQEAAKALVEAGSEPGFFNLDEDGESTWAHDGDPEGWVCICKRTNDPKLSWLEREFTNAGLRHQRSDTPSYHAPRLLVPQSDEDAAQAILNQVDSIPDDDPRWTP